MAEVGNFYSETQAVESLREGILQFGILDRVGVHHEFASGMHGRKLDFDRIPDDSMLYKTWITATSGFIRDEYPDLPDLVVGVANGTNRVALDVAATLRNNVIGVGSQKDPDNKTILQLSQPIKNLISYVQPKLAVVIEDVGTTGSNSVQVAEQVFSAGAHEVEVVNTWQRRRILEKLVAVGIHYRSIIVEEIETYPAEVCQRSEHCAEGWELM
jgi:orotate phosphoribosyltransferase